MTPAENIQEALRKGVITSCPDAHRSFLNALQESCERVAGRCDVYTGCYLSPENRKTYRVYLREALSELQDLLSLRPSPLDE